MRLKTEVKICFKNHSTIIVIDDLNITLTQTNKTKIILESRELILHSYILIISLLTKKKCANHSTEKYLYCFELINIGKRLTLDAISKYNYFALCN